MDLETLDLKQLKELRGQIDKAITSYEDRKKRAALDALKKVAEEHGYTLNQLVADGVQTRSQVAAKYANPDDPNQTWSGRGRRPHWVDALLSAGKSLDDIKV